jgi:hypothetical protein
MYLNTRAAEALAAKQRFFYSADGDPDVLVRYYFKATVFGAQEYRDRSKSRLITFTERCNVAGFHKRVPSDQATDHENKCVICQEGQDEGYCVQWTNQWPRDNQTHRLVWESLDVFMIRHLVAVPLLPLLHETDKRDWWEKQKGYHLTVPLMLALLEITQAALEVKIFDEF